MQKEKEAWEKVVEVKDKAVTCTTGILKDKAKPYKKYNTKHKEDLSPQIETPTGPGKTGRLWDTC